MWNFKKFTSGFAALAVAATAFVAVPISAGAADSTTAFSQDFNSANDPTECGFVVTGTGVISDGKLVLTSGGNAGSDVYADATASFTAIPAGNEITFSCTWATGNATGTRGYSKLVLSNGTKNALEIQYIGGDKDLKVNGIVVNDNLARDGKYDVKATLDMNTKKITALSVGSAYTLSTPIDFMDATVADISAFKFSANAKAGWQNTTSIDNVSITYTEAKLAVNSIVVNYTYNSSVVSTDTIDATGKYVGDTANIPFRKYIFQNGVLYQTTKSNSNPYYGVSTAMTLNTVVQKSLSVVPPAEGTSFVALYDDGSDTSNSADIRGSYMTAKRGDIELGSVEPGIYKITYNQYIRGGAPALYLDDEKVCDLNKHESSWGEATTSDIQITNAGSLTIKSVDLTDWVLLIKTGDIVNAAVETATGRDHSIATSYSTENLAAVSGNIITWKIDVPVGAKLKLNEGTTAFSTKVNAADSNGHSAVNTAFSLGVKCSTPIITDGKVSIGLIVDGLYAPGSSAVIAAVGSAPTTYTEAGKYTAPSGTTGEFNETAELWGVDYMLTMMYSDDELMEITGDIASDDEGSASDINDFIDMSDENLDSEAVGEME